MQGLVFAHTAWVEGMGLHKVFLKNLIDLFEKSGLKKRDLAKLVGEHESTVGRWLNGDRQPSIDNIGSLAIALGCSPSDLLADSGDAVLASLSSDTEARVRIERAIRLKIAAEIAAPADGVVSPKKKPRN